MPVAVGMVELVTDAAVVVDPVRTAGTVDALVVDVGEVSVDEVSGSEVVLAVDVALLASDKGAVLVELVAVVESTSAEVADTNTAGPNTPVAVFVSDAVLSLVPLSKFLMEFSSELPGAPVVDEESVIEL